ncbi:MAG: 2-phosphosulfolactate phosphatase, partial [Frankia sp.]
MDVDVWGQSDYSVRFEWGPTGAARVAASEGILVVVDVLSFTTTVGVAAENGIAVYPAPWRDARAADLATRENAVLAVGRTQATETHPWSLSPAGMRAAPFTPRLVLPSPNGSSIASAASEVTVVAASLRNAGLVGGWLRMAAARRPRPVAGLAAGAKWPDGSL